MSSEFPFLGYLIDLYSFIESLPKAKGNVKLSSLNYLKFGVKAPKSETKLYNKLQ
jgi:hypothetical protein